MTRGGCAARQAGFVDHVIVRTWSRLFGEIDHSANRPLSSRRRLFGPDTEDRSNNLMKVCSWNQASSKLRAGKSKDVAKAAHVAEIAKCDVAATPTIT